jgi:hypothetical protein
MSMIENLLKRVKVNIKNEFIIDTIKISVYLLLSVILIISSMFFKNEHPLKDRVALIFIFSVFNLWCLISSSHRFKKLYTQMNRVELGPDLRNKSNLFLVFYIMMFLSSGITYFIMYTIPYIGR